MPFTTASITNTGGRAVNEDHVGFLETGGAGCWVVTDGLGGHGGGTTASRLAVETVLASFRSNPTVTAEALRAHLASAHLAIQRQQSEPGLTQMRSTVAVLLADERKAVSGHIGDSRLYHLQAGVVGFQTRDHSVPGALAASGAIDSEGIRFHEDRNRVLRSLGNDGDAVPSITERTLCQGDAFLLCTDGFWEYVTEEEMEVDSLKAASPADWLRLMTSRLLGRAKGENDNYTALAVYFSSTTAPVAARSRFRYGGKNEKFSVTEGAGWIAVACLTVTLVIFIVASWYPAPVFALTNEVRRLIHRGKQAVPPSISRPAARPPKEPESKPLN